MDGLRKQRKIYVRAPLPDEINANALLIQKGGMAVDAEGNLIVSTPEIREPAPAFSSESNIEARILSLLEAGGTHSSKEIKDQLHLDWHPNKITSFLKSKKSISATKTSPKRFSLKAKAQTAGVQARLF